MNFGKLNQYVQRNDFLIQVAKGNVPGHSLVYKFAEATVDTTIRSIWPLATTNSFWMPTSASTLEAISSSTNDTAVGTGARTITIYGLDASFNLISETLSMNGTSVTSHTTQSFIRVYRVAVDTVGTYATSSVNGANLGNITVRTVSGSVPVGYIDYDSKGYGSTQQAHYTVPKGHTLMVYDYFITVETTKTVDVYTWNRPNANNTTTYTSKRLIYEFKGLAQNETKGLAVPFSLPEYTDFWWSAASASATAVVSVAFLCVLIDNNY